MIRAAVLAIASAVALIGCASSPAGLGKCGTTVSVTVTPQAGIAPTPLVAQAVFQDEGLGWSFSWVVTRAGSNQPVPFTSSQDGATITVQADQPGTYHFQLTVTAADQACAGTNDVTVDAPTGRTEAWLLRFTPPVATGLPRQQRAIVLHGLTPLAHQTYALEAGLPLAATVQGPSGSQQATVRFASATGVDVIAGTGMNGVLLGMLLPDDTYTPLVIPFDETLAPRMLVAQTGAQAAQGPFIVDPGEAVSGTVRDEQGQPLAGVSVTLHAGQLPSGVGVSAQDGTYHLPASGGMYTVTADAPGRAELTGPAIAVAGPVQLDLAWTAARSAVTGQVTSSTGASMAAARVTVRGALAALGTMAVAGGQPQPIGGTAALVLETRGDGTLPALALPAGDYQVLAEPPQGVTDGATTTKLTVAGAAAWPLALAPLVQLGGAVTDGTGAPVPGVTVSAVEQGSPRALSAVTDGNGRYQLTSGIDPGLAADLFFDAPIYTDPNRHFRRAHVVAAAAQATADVQLVAGLEVSGTVLPPSGAALAGVRVEAYCASCADPTPGAACVTGSDGSFTLYLPDPGVQ